MKRIKQILVAAVFAIAAVIGLGTAVLAAYEATIHVTNNSTTAYTSLPLSVGVNVTYLKDNGYINATGLDTRVKYGSSALPHILRATNVSFIGNISASSGANFAFSTGNSLLSAFYIIFGLGGNITTADNAALEPANNSSVELSGYLDTTAGSGKNLVYKDDAVQAYIDTTTSGTINAVILNNATWATPSGLVSYGAWTSPANAWDDNVTSYSTETTATGSPNDTDYIVFDTPDVSIIGFRVFSSRSDASIDTIEVDAYYDAAWNSVFAGTLTVTGYQYFYMDTFHTVTQYRVRYKDNNNSVAYTAYLIESDYGTPVVATVAGVSSGEHTAKIYLDTTYLGLIIDEGEAGETSNITALSGLSVNNNANTWVWASGNVSSYLNYIKLSVNGTQQLWYQPADIISGSTLPDRAGTAQDGTINWGVMPAGITITIDSLLPTSSPIADNVTSTVGSYGNSTGASVDEPSGLYGELNGTGVVMNITNDVSDSAGLPRTLFWFIFAFLAICGAGVISFNFTHSLFLQFVLMLLILIAFVVGVKILPFWLVFVFIIDGISLMVASKQFGY